MHTCNFDGSEINQEVTELIDFGSYYKSDSAFTCPFNINGTEYISNSGEEYVMAHLILRKCDVRLGDLNCKDWTEIDAIVDKLTVLFVFTDSKFDG